MMNTKCNHSKGDMNVEAKSSSSGSCGKFNEVVIMLILIGSYYCFIHGYYCSTTVNTAALILMVDSITFGHEMVNILVSGEEYDKVFNHLDMLNAPFERKVAAKPKLIAKSEQSNTNTEMNESRFRQADPYRVRQKVYSGGQMQTYRFRKADLNRGRRKVDSGGQMQTDRFRQADPNKGSRRVDSGG
ncbi:hypothetical protein Tco_0670311 [Tanacetum coccineum]